MQLPFAGTVTLCARRRPPARLVLMKSRLNRCAAAILGLVLASIALACGPGGNGGVPRY